MTGQGQFHMGVEVVCLEEVTFGQKHEEVRECRCLNCGQREEPVLRPQHGSRPDGLGEDKGVRMAEWRGPEKGTKDEVRALRWCLALQLRVKTCGFCSKWDENSLEAFQQRSDVVWHVQRAMMAVELKRGFGDFEEETGESAGDAYRDPRGEMTVVKSGRQ